MRLASAVNIVSVCLWWCVSCRMSHGVRGECEASLLLATTIISTIRLSNLLMTVINGCHV